MFWDRPISETVSADSLKPTYTNSAPSRVSGWYASLPSRMFEQPRVGIVVYGSLLNPDDLRDLFGELSGRIQPVSVSGFQRRFNQAASWRETDGQHRAVLNVAPESDSWFNGLFVGDITRNEFQTYRQRERGYRLVEIGAEEIEPYDSQTNEIDTLTNQERNSHGLVLTTVGTKPDPEILPIEPYVDRCLTGADHWGQRFQQDFCSKTMVNTGETLAEYRSGAASDGLQN